MSMKTVLSASILGLAGLVMTGCMGDPSYYGAREPYRESYDPYYGSYDPYYGGGYYRGSAVIHDRGPAYRPPRYTRPRATPPRARPRDDSNQIRRMSNEERDLLRRQADEIRLRELEARRTGFPAQ